MRYAGKVALVTAGASGIGRATVERLAAEGARITFCDIAEAAGREVEARLRAAGADIHFELCDVTDEAAVARAVEGVMKRCGRLDVAMNVAGGHGPEDTIGRPLHETLLVSWEGTLKINLTGTFLCMKYEIPAMLQSGGGAIANVTSMAGVRVTEHASYAYATAKAGVVHLTEMAAVLYAPQNIRVNVIAPGLTGTAGLKALSPETINHITKAFHPMGRLIPPESQAAALTWLCSDDAADITGLTVPVDGGWSAK